MQRGRHEAAIACSDTQAHPPVLYTSAQVQAQSNTQPLSVSQCCLAGLVTPSLCCT